MPSCSLELAARRLDDALGGWRPHRSHGHVWWIGPEHVPLSQVAVRWPVGYQDEGADEAGYAHLAEHVLFRGAPGRETREDLLLAVGGLSNGRTNARATMFWSAASHERRAAAFDNEAGRYAETVDPSWVAHQAEVVRAELLHKTKGAVDGYARIRRAVDDLRAPRGVDGFGRDAVASGLGGFDGFLGRCYRGAPIVALSGFPRAEAIARSDAEPLADIAVRTSGRCADAVGPAVDADADDVGRARLHPVAARLGIVDRALLGAASGLLGGAPDAQVRLHLWGDPVTETTTAPFLLMVESEPGAGDRLRHRLAALDADAIARIVDAARAPAAARLSRLAAQLRGPWAAQSWSSLLERTGDRGFAAPRSPAGTVDRAVRRTRRLLASAIAEEVAA